MVISFASTTKHFLQRASQRGLRLDIAAFILDHGVEHHGNDTRLYTIVDSLLPFHLAGCEAALRARDWIILTTLCGKLLTCYRRPDAVRFLREHTARHRHSRRAA